MFVVYWGLLLASGTICLSSELLSSGFSLVQSGFSLGQFFTGVYSGPICSGFGFIFLSSRLVHFKFALGFLLVHSGFAVGLFSTGIYSSLIILAAHLLWVCCSLAFTPGLLAALSSQFARSGFSSG